MTRPAVLDHPGRGSYASDVNKPPRKAARRPAAAAGLVFSLLGTAEAVEYVSALNVAARSLGVQLEVLNVSAPEELNGAFAEISRRRAEGLVVLPDGMFWAVRADIVRLAGKARVPAIYWERAYVEVGGLLSYAASLSDIARRGGVLVDKILNGAKPATLPVEQPTSFEFEINKKTAKALGLTIPSSLLLRTDKVIE